MKKNKDLNKGVLHLLVNCITEGSPLWEAMQNNEKLCFSKSYLVQCI